MYSWYPFVHYFWCWCCYFKCSLWQATNDTKLTFSCFVYCFINLRSLRKNETNLCHWSLYIPYQVSWSLHIPEVSRTCRKRPVAYNGLMHSFLLVLEATRPNLKVHRTFVWPPVFHKNLLYTFSLDEVSIGKFGNNVFWIFNISCIYLPVMESSLWRCIVM